MTYKFYVTWTFNEKCSLIQIPINKLKRYIFGKNETFNNAKVVNCSTDLRLTTAGETIVFQ